MRPAPVLASELEAQADGRVDGGFVKETAGETVRDLRIHGACVGIEALGKSIIDQEGNRIELSAACREGSIRTTDHTKAVLLLVVVGRNQIDIRPDGVLRAGPKYLQIPGIRKSGVAD